MDYLLAIAAGAIQGLTEFLPISSTGHLIIFEKVLKLNPNYFGLEFDASLHLGTLLAVILFFYKDYLKIFSKNRRLLINLAVGTLPAVIAGLLFEDYIDTTLRQLWIVGLALILFSFVFLLAEKLGKKVKDIEQTSIKDSLIIGISQAIALIPGVSRSGATISAGLFQGMKREEAARFAFMLSGPIIAGAGGKKFLDVVSSQGLQSQTFSFIIIGIISSAIFGYLTIKFFLKYVSQKSLFPFVVYRIILGLILIIFSILQY